MAAIMFWVLILKGFKEFPNICVYGLIFFQISHLKCDVGIIA